MRSLRLNVTPAINKYSFSGFRSSLFTLHSKAMELSATLNHSISPIPTIKLFTAAPSFPSRLRSLPLSRFTARRLPSRVSYFKATPEENFSTGPNRYFGEVSDGVDVLEEVMAVEKNVCNKKLPVEEAKEDSASENDSSTFEFLENLNIKLDSEDAYSILLYGSGAVVALWLASAVVGAVDSIPLFPKLMEVVGLGYTCWFGSRYLVFKENRKELAAKIEEYKQQVLGSDDE